MPSFTKECLETLRHKIDLVDLLSSYLELKPAGGYYKALCPFHDEKTPSFGVQKGAFHYHCFGCSVHGDAIEFLMDYLKMTFQEAVETLAERYHVHLEYTNDRKDGPNKTELFKIMEFTTKFYHFVLLHTKEGREALHYLYQRGISLEFIKQFQIGLASKSFSVYKTLIEKGFKKKQLLDTGIITQADNGRVRDFFYDRIIFSIRDFRGAIIGFSGRKYKEETGGGKYVNSKETYLFKKSQALFGLSYCRRRIAKERKAIIVEGQIDALRLIYEGLNLTVASQGTAFTEAQADQLIRLGVEMVILAFDSDSAGIEASLKTGHLLQKKGIAVFIVNIPDGIDPDQCIRDHGINAFQDLLEDKTDYLTYLFLMYSKKIDLHNPAEKSRFLQTMTTRIKEWDDKIMVYESLKKLASLTQVPESMLGIDNVRMHKALFFKPGKIDSVQINSDRILECDFLYWLLMMGKKYPKFINLARNNIKKDHIYDVDCRNIYQTLMNAYTNEEPKELLSLVIDLNQGNEQDVISEILEKKVNKDKAEEYFISSLQEILNRDWMQRRDNVRVKLQSGNLSDEEAIELAKEFESLIKIPPQISMEGI